MAMLRMIMVIMMMVMVMIDLLLGFLWVFYGLRSKQGKQGEQSNQSKQGKHSKQSKESFCGATRVAPEKRSLFVARRAKKKGTRGFTNQHSDCGFSPVSFEDCFYCTEICLFVFSRALVCNGIAVI